MFENRDFVTRTHVKVPLVLVDVFLLIRHLLFIFRRQLCSKIYQDLKSFLFNNGLYSYLNKESRRKRKTRKNKVTLEEYKKKVFP